MIDIEFEDPQVAYCECCGKEIVRLTRFVYQDGDAFAVYYLLFTRGHTPKVADGIISLGEWGEGSGPDQRLAFPFRIWTNDLNYQVGLVDAEASPWCDVTFLGRIVNRDEALQHEWVQDVFHITDHIVADDTIVVDFFQTQ